MLWIGLGALLLLALFFVSRARSMGPLFSDAHLVEVAAALPELKRRALAGQADQPTDQPPSIRTAVLAVAYTIRRDGADWFHHLSVSNPVTPARAAGTFFLGLARGLLRFEPYPTETFVSQNRVFHLVVRLSDDEHQAFAAAPPLEPQGAKELRELAITGQSALRPLLQERAVPVPPASSPPG